MVREARHHDPDYATHGLSLYSMAAFRKLFRSLSICSRVHGVGQGPGIVCHRIPIADAIEVVGRHKMLNAQGLGIGINARSAIQRAGIEVIVPLGRKGAGATDLALLPSAAVEATLEATFATTG